eukprot:766421-Hanusia_phi.AAC.5
MGGSLDGNSVTATKNAPLLKPCCRQDSIRQTLLPQQNTFPSHEVKTLEIVSSHITYESNIQSPEQNLILLHKDRRQVLCHETPSPLVNRETKTHDKCVPAVMIHVHKERMFVQRPLHDLQAHMSWECYHSLYTHAFDDLLTSSEGNTV